MTTYGNNGSASAGGQHVPLAAGEVATVGAALAPADVMPSGLVWSGCAISPDGKMVAYIRSVPGPVHTVWVQELEEGSEPRELTVFDGRAAVGVAWSPDSQTVAVAADRSYDPIVTIWLLPVAGGQPRAIRTPRGYPAYFGAEPFSPDGAAFAYMTPDGDPAVLEVMIYDLAQGTSTRVVGDTGSNTPVVTSWSPDGRWLLVALTRSNTDIGCGLVCVDDATMRAVIPAEGKNIPGPWEPDSSAFHVLTDVDREFVAVGRYRLADEKLSIVQDGDWDITQYMTGGDTVVRNENVGGVDQLEVSCAGRRRERIAGLPAGTVELLTLSRDGSRMAMVVSTATRPADVAVMSLDWPSLRWVTDNRPSGAGRTDPVEPTLVHYPSAGVEVPGWLYRPRREGPVPVVMLIHGGPEMQARRGYGIGLPQWLVAHGIAVLAPNIRGSSGYGLSYQRAIHQDWGGVDMVDFEHGLKFLRNQPWVRDDRIGLIGGSYGGFAVLSLLSRLPQWNFAAGVAIAPPTDLVAVATSAPPGWSPSLAVAFGDAVADRERLTQRSPITHAAAIRAPVLILQPAHDEIVRRDHTDRFVATMENAGRDVTYHVDPRSGHELSDPAEAADYMRMVGDFFATHLLD